MGGIQIKQEQFERRALEAEQRLEELVQGQATAEQEAERIVQARAELDEVRKQFDAAKTENLVSSQLKRAKNKNLKLPTLFDCRLSLRESTLFHQRKLRWKKTCSILWPRKRNSR